MPPSKQAKSVFCPRKHHAFIFLLAFFTAWFLVALWVLHGHSPLKEYVSPYSTTLSDKTTETVDLYPEGAHPVIGIHETVTVTSQEDHDEQQRQQRSTEIVYAISKNFKIPQETRGHVIQVALLLHGCSHSALKFFSPSSSCPTCIGLSEELNIARILLQEPSIAVVIAVTSQDRKSGCWAPPKDSPHVVDALQYVIARLQQQQQNQQHPAPPPPVKVWAFGASSGGRFAAQLAIDGTVHAAMVGVMSLGTDLVRKWNDIPMSRRPPIYLAPMPRDKRTLKGNEQDYAEMTRQQKQIHAVGARVVLDIDTCAPFPVSALYLHQRVPHMTLDMATDIVSQLQINRHLDPVSGVLLKDPTHSDWRDVLLATCGADANRGCLQNQALGPGISPLAKALHRAWAFHEYCSEVILKALQYFQHSVG